MLTWADVFDSITAKSGEVYDPATLAEMYWMTYLPRACGWVLPGMVW